MEAKKRFLLCLGTISFFLILGVLCVTGKYDTPLKMLATAANITDINTDNIINRTPIATEKQTIEKLTSPINTTNTTTVTERYTPPADTSADSQTASTSTTDTAADNVTIEDALSKLVSPADAPAATAAETPAAPADPITSPANTPTVNTATPTAGTPATATTPTAPRRTAIQTGTTPTAPTATNTPNATNVASKPVELKIIGDMLSSPVTVNQTVCIELNQAVDSVTFKVMGPQEKNFNTYKVLAKYCSYVNIFNLEDGKYKFIVEARKGSEVAAKSMDIEIKKSEAAQKLIQDTKVILQDECTALGNENLEDCKNFLIQRYRDKVQCQDMTDEECRASLEKTSIETILYAQKRYDIIKQKVENIAGKEMSVSQLEEVLNEQLENKDVTISFKTKDINVKAIKATESMVIGKDNKLIQAAPVAVTVDSDGDGIPDDIEKRLGTDPNKADTDGDGFGDLEEILKGYNPLGEGNLQVNLSSIDNAIINNQTLEHPTSNGTEKDNFTIKKIENASTSAGQTEGQNGYIISGTAEPNSVATLYIYSDIPVVTTVTTDEYGNWEYHFDEPLEDGNHEVYVAVNDNTGKVINKSRPLDFLIQEAKAVTITDQAESAEKTSRNMINYYILAAITVIVAGILVFLFALLKQKNKLQQ